MISSSVSCYLPHKTAQIKSMLLHGSQVVVIMLFTYSLWKNNIGVAGAQSLAEGLPHYTNPQDLV